MPRADWDEKHISETYETLFDSKQRWWVPYTNQLAVVRQGINLPPRVIISDQTLREGVSTHAPKDFSLADRLRVLRALEAAGVQAAEVGCYAYGPPVERELIREAKRQGTKVRLGVHAAAFVKDFKKEVDTFAEAGVDFINFLQHGATYELAMSPGLRPGDLPGRSADCVGYAKQLGLHVGFGMAASGRVEPSLEEDVYRAAAEAGADRFYMYDGAGAQIPEAMEYCVRRLRDIVGPGSEIAIHCHNDFGLATANTIAAVKAGATVIDASVNGLGNRIGVTALEEIVAILTVLYGVDTGIEMAQLAPLSAVVSQTFEIPIPRDKSVIGDNLYTHEADNHIAQILSGHWYAWNAIKAETLGRKNILNIVPRCIHKLPNGTIAAKIRQMGLTVTDAQLDLIVVNISEIVDKRTPPAASETELESVIREVVGD